MGAFTSRRQNAAVGEEADQSSSSHAYKYPPRSGNFFGSHFIMGGERFDTPQPEAYLFGENQDLNFLGNRPTAFPYPPPQANEPTKTLKSLVNIRKESVRFVRVTPEKQIEAALLGGGDGVGVGGCDHSLEQLDGNVLCSNGGSSGDGPTPASYNIEFTFDSDAKCAITIYYFCTEEVSPSGVTLVPRDGLTSETYHYEKGINQCFSQPGHIFNPQLIPEDDLIYNPTKEQYPVAIHCVVEEGNEECRQSHSTICVIDHHPENNSYVLRALKQKIFVDGLCYLLQEIYGIENKAVNKSSIDEEIDDHGSECVICMSETRDTLILPCRHLCLCNSCADSLRYQANNCPICRAPFRALLQIRAVQKGVSSHVLHQNTPTSAPGEPIPCDQHVPAGYIPVSLIEALNGPLQYVARTRPSDGDMLDGNLPTAPGSMDNHKSTSPLKPNSQSQRRSKIKKNVSTSTNTSEVGTITNATTATNANAAANAEEDANEQNPTSNQNSTASSGVQRRSPPPGKRENMCSRTSQDKLHIVNERHSLKLPKSKRNANNASASNSGSSSSHNDEADDDSESEKLSPLLSSNTNSNSKQTAPLSKPKIKTKLQNVVDNVHGNGVGSDDIAERHDDVELVECNAGVLKKHKRPDLTGNHNHTGSGVGVGGNAAETAAGNAEDSDYYTPEDTQNSILSPLCPAVDRSGGRSADKLCNLKSNAGSFKSANSLVKRNLHKKSTSVGNIVGPGGNNGIATATGELKGNVSSLPDMLDSPGQSASTRSSSDSYSSSSSTKQLLSSNPTTVAANIIVDDKTALQIQNAVNV